MRKIYKRLSNQQWRITMPNLHFIKRKDETPITTKLTRNSGSYDFQEAQKQYDRSVSLPNKVYVNDEICSDSDSSDNDDDQYEDARNSREFYVDIEYPKLFNSTTITTTTTTTTQQDIPKISFQFFEKTQPVVDNNGDKKQILKSELKMLVNPSKSTSLDDLRFQQSIEILPVVGVIKCGSDSNLNQYRTNDSDENLYKIPKSHNKQNRLSRSLNDFNIEQSPPLQTTSSSNHSSTEHVSCSQNFRTIIERKKPNDHADDCMDYCKVRSRLPLKLRRPTFLCKPHNKAIDSWNNIKTKWQNTITEQAAQQRVGAFDDKQKIVINFDEVLQNSKTKCKNALKLFVKKQQPPKQQAENVNQIVKNDAFFSRLTPNDIEYKLNYNNDTSNSDIGISPNRNNTDNSDFNSAISTPSRNRKKDNETPNGFEDLRKYVKHGGDFCKELAVILQERAEAETQYAKNLSKLSTKLLRACRDGVGCVNEAWKSVAIELEQRAEIHRLFGTILLDETAKPLRSLNEKQHRTRKQCEISVDKAAKSLNDWRTAEAKAKKQSHTCARDNEKLQDAAVLDNKANKITLSRNASLIQLAHLHKNSSEKETAKLECKKKKAEDAVKKADIEYYTLCVRAERARLEWESAILRGVNTFQLLEEERLRNLNSILRAYYQRGAEISPRLSRVMDNLKNPVSEAEPSKDLTTFLNLKESSQQISEQLLPDFYCEHITLAMNRERRKQALVKLLQLIRQDIERERKSKNGLENLSKAMRDTPNFGSEDSQQTVSEKIYHMKSMLTYLEGARYKVHSALAELDSRPKSGHPLAPHIAITRDKCGLQQSILKVPQWLREEWFETQKSPLSDKSELSDLIDPDQDWLDRGAADGNSNQPDSDFDEFSSQCSSTTGNDENPVQPIAKCRALYAYTPNLTDELALNPGDLLSVYRQQDDGWWLGECRGNVGIFPATYVELIENEAK